MLVGAYSDSGWDAAAAQFCDYSGWSITGGNELDSAGTVGMRNRTHASDDQDWAEFKETALARVTSSDHLLQAARWIAELSLADAGPVYEKAIDALVVRKTNRSYRAAVRALLEARPVFCAASAFAFDECVSRLRETHFRKRNFMAALDEEFGAA